VSRTRVIRVGPVDGGTPDINFTGTRQTEGSGVTENNSGSFTLSNSLPNTQRHVFGFEQDFRTSESTFNIPASRCIVEYKARPKIGLSVNSGGTGVIFDIRYISTSQNLSNLSTSSLTSNFNLETFVQTGSDVTTRTANLQPIAIDGPLQSFLQGTNNDQFVAYQISTSNNNSNGLHSITLNRHTAILEANTGPAGALTRSWEADDIVIDANDPVVFTPPTTTLTCLGGILREGQSAQTVTATVDEDSLVIKLAVIDDIATTTNLTATANVTFDATKNLTANTTVLSTTENFVFMDAKTLSSSTALTATPLFKPGVDDTLTTTSALSITPTFKIDIIGDYTWDTFQLNSYFEVGYSVDDFVLNEGEYTWLFLAGSSWDDWPVETWLGDEAGWDNWPGDAWATPFVKNAVGSLTVTPSLLIGDTVSYTGTFSLEEDTARGQFGEADLNSAITMEVTATGTLEAVAHITSAFSPTLTSNITYALEEKITITGAFNTTLTASAITDTFADIDVTTSISITPTFRPAGESIMAVSSTTTLTPTFKPAGLAALVGFVSTLQTARVFYQADPYFTIKVATETRQLVLPIENRQTLVKQENRLNTITVENRDYLVSQETRKLKLRTPPFRNRFTTPRVRQEQ